MAVSFFIRNKKVKIATLFARIRSKAKDIDIKASTLLEVDVAAWEKSQESAIKRKNYRNDKNNKEFFDKLDLIEKTLNSILDSDTNVTNELVIFAELQAYARDKVVFLISHRLYHFPQLLDQPLCNRLIIYGTQNPHIK